MGRSGRRCRGRLARRGSNGGGWIWTACTLLLGGFDNKKLWGRSSIREESWRYLHKSSVDWISDTRGIFDIGYLIPSIWGLFDSTQTQKKTNPPR
jgi:hypothetical protein